MYFLPVVLRWLELLPLRSCYGLADSAAEITSPLDTAFETLANQTLKDWHVPGISIAVVQGAQTFAKVRIFPSVK